MGKQIEFPKNFNMYMTQVMRHLREGSVEKAVDYMIRAYEIKKENSLNVLLVSSLLQIGQYKKALVLATEKSDFYETDEKRLLIYVEVLLENNQILQAENYIKKQLTSSDIKYMDSWIRLSDQLKENKRVQEENKRKAEERIMKQLFSLASLNTLEQFSVIEEVYRLPNEKLTQVAPQLLVNPYVHPLIRATVFSLLAERCIENSYAYLWFDETKEIRPSDTRPLDSNPTVKSLRTMMADNLAQNPSLFQLAKNEMNTVVLMLYPFIDDVINSGEEKNWVQYIIHSIDQDSSASDTLGETEVAYISEWVEKIHSEMLRFE